MATIINNPGEGSSDSGMGVGLVIGILLAILVVVLFIIYALPAIRNNNQEQNSPSIEITLPPSEPKN